MPSKDPPNSFIIERHQRYVNYPGIAQRTTATRPTGEAHHAETMRLSGLQKEVLALYRQCLRGTRKKPEVRTAVTRRVSTLRRLIRLTSAQNTRSHFENFARCAS